MYANFLKKKYVNLFSHRKFWIRKNHPGETQTPCVGPRGQEFATLTAMLTVATSNQLPVHQGYPYHIEQIYVLLHLFVQCHSMHEFQNSIRIFRCKSSLACDISKGAEWQWMPSETNAVVFVMKYIYPGYYVYSIFFNDDFYQYKNKAIAHRPGCAPPVKWGFSACSLRVLYECSAWPLSVFSSVLSSIHNPPILVK